MGFCNQKAFFDTILTMVNQIYQVEQYLSDDNKIVTDEQWRQDGKLSRIDGPAITERDTLSGFLISEGWFLNGNLHREGGPAQIGYDPENDGTVLEEIWFWHGVRHRRDGPAVIRYNELTHEVEDTEWWIDGLQIDPNTTAIIPSSIKHGPNI